MRFLTLGPLVARSGDGLALTYDQGAELVVRWLASHVAAPDADDAEAGARLLAAVLPLRALAPV